MLKARQTGEIHDFFVLCSTDIMVGLFFKNAMEKSTQKLAQLG